MSHSPLMESLDRSPSLGSAASEPRRVRPLPSRFLSAQSGKSRKSAKSTGGLRQHAAIRPDLASRRTTTASSQREKRSRSHSSRESNDSISEKSIADDDYIASTPWCRSAFQKLRSPFISIFIAVGLGVASIVISIILKHHDLPFIKSNGTNISLPSRRDFVPLHVPRRYAARSAPTIVTVTRRALDPRQTPDGPSDGGPPCIIGRGVGRFGKRQCAPICNFDTCSDDNPQCRCTIPDEECNPGEGQCGWVGCTCPATSSSSAAPASSSSPASSSNPPSSSAAPASSDPPPSSSSPISSSAPLTTFTTTVVPTSSSAPASSSSAPASSSSVPASSVSTTASTTASVTTSSSAAVVTTAQPTTAPAPVVTVTVPTAAPTPATPGQTPAQGGQPAAGAQPQPAAGQPAAGQPAAGQPAAGQPAAGQPAAGQPAAGQPAAGQPAAGQPAAGQPAVGAQPAAGQPQAAVPNAGQPAAATGVAVVVTATPGAVVTATAGGAASTGTPRSGSPSASSDTPQSETQTTGGTIVSLPPIPQGVSTFAIMAGVTGLTEASGYAHAATLRTALAQTGQLDFNTNLRIFTTSGGFFSPNGALSNGLHFIGLVAAYAAASMVFVGIQGGVAIVSWIPLLVLGIATTGTALLAWLPYLFIKYLSTTNSPLEMAAACVAAESVHPRPGRCTHHVHESKAKDAEGEARQLSDERPSAWESRGSVRRIIFVIWTVAAGGLIWAIASMAYLGSRTGFAARDFIPMAGPSTGAIKIRASLNSNIVGGDILLDLLIVALVQLFWTVALNLAELILALSRDESDWRMMTTDVGAKAGVSPFWRALTSWQTLSLLGIKPVVHWLFGEAMGRSSIIEGGKSVGALVMRPIQIFYLAIGFIGVAAYLTWVARQRPTGVQPATYGHIQTLVDLIDEWPHSKTLYWGHKDGCEVIEGHAHLGTSDEKLPPPQPGVLYA